MVRPPTVVRHGIRLLERGGAAATGLRAESARRRCEETDCHLPGPSPRSNPSHRFCPCSPAIACSVWRTDLTDEAPPAPASPRSGGLLRLGHEGSCFMQVLFDLCLQIGRRHGSAERRPIRISQAWSTLCSRLMQLHLFRMHVAAGIEGTSVNQPSPTATPQPPISDHCPVRPGSAPPSWELAQRLRSRRPRRQGYLTARSRGRSSGVLHVSLNPSPAPD